METKNLRVKINGDAKDLRAELSRTKSSFASFTKSLKSIGTAIVGAFAFNEVRQGILGVTNDIDALVHTSTRLGLTADSLQQLRYAAEMAGISTSTLEMAMQRMTRRVAEAAQGTGEAKSAIAELGLSAQQLSRMSPDAQLKIFADALKDVENQSDRVRLAMKLFDSEGVQLLNMLQDGSVGINKYANELARLGTITQEEAQTNAKFKEVLTQINAIFSLMAQKIVSAVQPALISIANAFRDGAVDGNTFENVTRSVSATLLTLIDIAKAAMLSLKGVYDIGKAVGSFAASSVFDIWGDEDKAKQYEKNMNAAIDSVASNFSSVRNIVSDIGGLYEQHYNSIKMGNDGLKMSAATHHEIGAIIKDNAQTLSKTSSAAKSAASEVKKEFNSLEGTFDGFFDNLMRGTQSWGDAFKNLLKELAIELAKVAVINKTSSSLGGLFGGLFSNIDFFAKGGVVSTPTAFAHSGGIGVAGEAGSEAILPLTRTSSGDLGVKAQAAQVNVNVINNSNSSVDVIDDGRGNIEIVINKIVSDIMRGTGTIGSALERRYGLVKA